MRPTRRGPAKPGPVTTTQTADQAIRLKDTGLAEDAVELVTEAVRFLEAGERVLGHALLVGDRAELVEAAEHSVRCSARARRFLSMALHVDLERVA